MEFGKQRFCTVSYDKNEQVLKLVTSGDDIAGVRITCGTKRVDIKQLGTAVDQYWQFVNGVIESGDLNQNDQEKMKRIYDDLKTEGANLAQCFLTADMREKLWKRAAQVDVFVIWGELQWIPWEALYYRSGNTGSFLSDVCVISRWPETDEESEIDYENTFAESRIVCLDALLDANEDARIDNDSLSQFFRGLGEVVHVTRHKGELEQRVCQTKLIHWICEHEEGHGLRLDESTYFSEADCHTVRFPSRSALILTSCSASKGIGHNENLAARIAASSYCTVIAPSSVIAARSGVRFVQILNRFIDDLDADKPLGYLWKKLRVPETSEEGERFITEEMCYSLWYAIYGDAMLNLGGGDNGNRN